MKVTGYGINRCQLPAIVVVVPFSFLNFIDGQSSEKMTLTHEHPLSFSDLKFSSDPEC